ncbi:DUF2235 domain-containing protein [Sulfitobacter sp.]|uniref:phospholipase effector Tle1 domain-containing protein n=1 Tax=Sulfitobacter sp. TaxID=1903071 RepID=UPI00261FC00F|nr:DUF2235 domain-containing protein [Sulfitobacter sp.]
MGREVFVLIDGTGCTLATGTNVGRLVQLVDNASYRHSYQIGVGTISRTRLLDRLFAPNLEPEAYQIYNRLLDMQLETTDRLHIIGYSRGAVIARILALAIVSSSALKAIVGAVEVPQSIAANVAFLGLVDPVVGWPRLHSRRVKDHQAVWEQKIGCYLELIALNEPRALFRSDNHWASKRVRSKAKKFTSTASFQSAEDRANAMKMHFLRRTRKTIFMPGRHSDVGGQQSDAFIASHALLTLLEELVAASKQNGRPLEFLPNDVADIFAQILRKEEPKAGFVSAVKALFVRVVSFGFRNRKIDSLKPTQDFGHYICASAHPHRSYNEKVTSDCARYPDYPNLRCVAKV